jgi:cytochrome c oxidase subunit IV
MKIITGLIILSVTIIVDVLVGLAVNELLLAFAVTDPTGFVILIILLLDIVGIIVLGKTIASFFSGL